MNEILRRIQAFFDIVSTRNVLIEVGVIGVCLLIGGLVGLELNRRSQRQKNNPPMALAWRYFATQGNVVVTPIIVVFALVMVANSTLQAAHFDVTLLGAAARLILAYIVVRIGVLVFAASLGNKSWIQNWETRVALLIWLIIAAEYLGWLDPIIATLDSVGIAAGKSRITVWSVLKLLFTLTLFMLAAAWISRWVERRVKKLTSVAMSTRIGIAKFSNAFLIALSILIGLNAAGVDLTALRRISSQASCCSWIARSSRAMSSVFRARQAPAPRISAGCRNCAAAMWWCAIATGWKCWCRISNSSRMR
jgi:hypothetical protein